MREIGGYLELELHENDSFPHSSGILVNSGRHALEYLLLSLKDSITGIVLPYFTCEAILQPINRLGIAKRFYHVNSNLHLSIFPELTAGEILVVNNYFGLFDEYIGQLAFKYGKRVIIDNAQAWYAKEVKDSYGIYSPRKYFGIPDGGVLTGLPEPILQLDQDYSYDRCKHLLKRIDLGASTGYDDFKEVSNQLSQSSLKSMSALTFRLLSSINYNAVRERRRMNYSILAGSLDELNLIKLPSVESFSCPMIYPFLSDKIGLRQYLIDKKVFVATYWPNVFDWCPPDSVEFSLAKRLLPLPIDQRYGEKEMNHIVRLIKEYG